MYYLAQYIESVVLMDFVQCLQLLENRMNLVNAQSVEITGAISQLGSKEVETKNCLLDEELVSFLNDTIRLQASRVLVCLRLPFFSSCEFFIL